MNTNPCMPCEEVEREYTHEHCDDGKKDKCYEMGCQYADISIPIEICPAADLGEIKTECCGEPYIQCEHEPCGSNLNIIVTQSVKIKIPVKFGIKTIEGNGFIKCSDDCCDK